MKVYHLPAYSVTTEATYYYLLLASSRPASASEELPFAPCTLLDEATSYSIAPHA
jgi:hypothetical protein